MLHAGGVLRDALLQKQTPSGFRTVLAPKAQGTANLGRFASCAPLAAVKLFSSIAASMGSGGQANYAAANAVMDRWAHQQQAQVMHPLLKPTALCRIVGKCPRLLLASKCKACRQGCDWERRLRIINSCVEDVDWQ